MSHFYLQGFCQTSPQGGHALVALFTDGAMPLHKVTCIPRGHALGLVSLGDCLASSVPDPSFFLIKTTQLAEDDRYSVSFKQYLAGIDVSMGGRVAEELSKSFFAHSLVYPLLLVSLLSVYGSENVSSGASSDIKQATKTAEAMVKVIRLRFDKLTSGFKSFRLILELGLL